MFYKNAMKFASEEIRTKAVNAYLNEKDSFKRIIKKIFGYSVATICNWVRIFQNENRLSANPNGHRGHPIIKMGKF